MLNLLKSMNSVRSAGYVLLIIGLGSAVLYLIGFNIKFLVWIDMWGEEVGWIIRAGIILFGVFLHFVGGLMEEEPCGGSEI